MAQNLAPPTSIQVYEILLHLVCSDQYKENHKDNKIKRWEVYYIQAESSELLIEQIDNTPEPTDIRAFNNTAGMRVLFSFDYKIVNATIQLVVGVDRCSCILCIRCLPAVGEVSNCIGLKRIRPFDTVLDKPVKAARHIVGDEDDDAMDYVKPIVVSMAAEDRSTTTRSGRSSNKKQIAYKVPTVVRKLEILNQKLANVPPNYVSREFSKLAKYGTERSAKL
jgi:hypothetical protein